MAAEMLNKNRMMVFKNKGKDQEVSIFQSLRYMKIICHDIEYYRVIVAMLFVFHDRTFRLRLLAPCGMNTSAPHFLRFYIISTNESNYRVLSLDAKHTISEQR